MLSAGFSRSLLCCLLGRARPSFQRHTMLRWVSRLRAISDRDIRASSAQPPQQRRDYWPGRPVTSINMTPLTGSLGLAPTLLLLAVSGGGLSAAAARVLPLQERRNTNPTKPYQTCYSLYVVLAPICCGNCCVILR